MSCRTCRRVAPGARAIAVWVLALAACPAAAEAQIGWTSIVPPGVQSQPVFGPRLTVDDAGNAVVVWAETETRVGDLVLRASRYSRSDGAWSAVQQVVPSSVAVRSPDVASDSHGNVVVAWARLDATSYTIQVARYSSATEAWSTPLDLTGPEVDARAPRAAVDSHGNVVVAWAQADGSVWRACARRYAAATGTWGPTIALSPAGQDVRVEALVADTRGNVTAGWTLLTADGSAVQVARHAIDADEWTPPLTLSPAGQEANGPSALGVDGDGDVVAVWRRGVSSWYAGGEVQAARFDAAQGTWGAAVELSPPAAQPASLAVDPSGSAIAVWPQAIGTACVIRAARYAADHAAWAPSTDLASLADGVCSVTSVTARVDVDAAGNAVAVWGTPGGPVQASTYVAAAGRWSPARGLGGPYAQRPDVAFDAPGSATVVWADSYSYWVPLTAAGGFWHTDYLIGGARWQASPGAPAITGVAPGAGTLVVHVAPPVTSEPALAPINYEYSVDGGASWRPRDPASTDSPIVVAGLTDFAWYALRVRAVNVVGPGLASTAVTAIAGPVPGPPSDLRVTQVAGNTVTLVWTPAPGGLAPTHYLVEGGLVRGQTLASLSTGGPSRSFTFVAPTGAFHVRVVGVAGAVRGAPSNEVRLFVNVPEPPSAPSHLLGLVNGADLALSWTPTFGGGTPTSHVLNVSGALSGAVPLPTGEAFTFAGVPPGTYTLSVSARNAAGTSAPSNSLTLTFPTPCSGVPDLPTRFVVTKSAGTISVMWSPPEVGPAVAGYVLSVTGSYIGAFPTSGRALAGAVGPGSYTLSVLATNPCGTGPGTAPVTVVVP